jgi:hypothetical protein
MDTFRGRTKLPNDLAQQGFFEAGLRLTGDDSHAKQMELSWATASPLCEPLQQTEKEWLEAPFNGLQSHDGTESKSGDAFLDFRHMPNGLAGLENRQKIRTNPRRRLLRDREDLRNVVPFHAANGRD